MRSRASDSRWAHRIGAALPQITLLFLPLLSVNEGIDGNRLLRLWSDDILRANDYRVLFVETSNLAMSQGSIPLQARIVAVASWNQRREAFRRVHRRKLVHVKGSHISDPILNHWFNKCGSSISFLQQSMQCSRTRVKSPQDRNSGGACGSLFRLLPQ